MENNETVTEETILYVNLLISGQAVINSIDRLQGSKYYKKKLKEFGQPFYNQIHKELGKDIHKIWNNDDVLAMEMTRSIIQISKLIAEGNGQAIAIIDQMIQKGFDFSKYKLVEI